MGCRYVLVCETCGKVGAKKRFCPHLVNDRMFGRRLSFCPASVLCKRCFRKKGGIRGVHGRCAEDAARRQKKYDEEFVNWQAGLWQLSTRWGDREPRVPPGMAAALYRWKGGPEGKDCREVLVPADSYNAWLTTEEILALPLSTRADAFE